MERRKITLLYTAVVLWGFLVMTLLVYLLFPYQKALTVVFQSMMKESDIVASLGGTTFSPTGIQIAKVVISHPAVEGKPVLELSKVHFRWNPLSLISRKMTVFLEGHAYNGLIQGNIRDIPVVTDSTPDILITFMNVDLGYYPEGILPGFKGMSGKIDGWVRMQVPLGRPDLQKGSFGVRLTNGEIKEVQGATPTRLTLPYKEIVAEGKVSGNRVTIDTIATNGSGAVDCSEAADRIVDIRLSYEAVSKNSPFAGKGVITISGNQWPPTVALIPAE